MGLITVITMIVAFFIGNRKTKLSNNSKNNLITLFVIGVSLWNVFWYGSQNYHDLWGRMSILAGTSSFLIITTQITASGYPNFINQIIAFFQRLINTWVKIALQLILMFCIIRYGYELVIMNIHP